MSRDALLDALGDGAVVATGNTRLARSLRADYEQRMLNAGRMAWSTPAVLPWDAWLLERYAEASFTTDLPLLMNAEQEEQLWATIIRRDGDALLRVEATARRAAAAWKLMRGWQLDIADRRFGLDENAEAFRRWARAFTALCRERNLAAEADVPGLLRPLVANRACSLPQRMLLAGLYELTPAQQKFAAALQEAGCVVDWVALPGRPGLVQRLGCADPTDEITQAASWARAVLEQEPAARIGIVVPDLAARRASLEHALACSLDPSSLRPGAALRPRPWNLSLGQPLAAWPVLRTALGLLGLMRGPVDTLAFGELLCSPHWALPADAEARRATRSCRALLDGRLRRRGDAAVRLSTLQFLADQCDEDGRPKPWRCAGLAQRLGKLLQRSHDLPAQAGTTAWAAEFTAWLKAAGWGGYAVGNEGGDKAGGRPLDSHEYQAVEAWNDLLSRFAGLEDFAGSLSLPVALSLLSRLAAETVFQPRGGTAGVQMLGLYEANGLAFDHLWVMGLHDAAWPPAPGPDPFIPLGLQRERGLPHCDPDREREWAEAVTAELAGAAPNVLFSYPARDGNEEWAPSPLLDRFRAGSVEDLPQPGIPSWRDAISHSAAPEPMPDHSAIALPAGTTARGGSRLFRFQAACPFRAFAEHRLGASPLDRVQAGLNAARRGSLLHEVLEALWKELQTQSALLALDDTALHDRVRAHVQAVLAEERRRSPVTLAARYGAVEAERLADKVLAWLAIERERVPFRVVGFEDEREFEIGGVTTRIVLDRVDELEDGARVVLDYKTGRVQPGGWFGERPDDPQLPLYGVAARADTDGGNGVAGIAFAQIRPDQATVTGVVRDEHVLPGLPVKRKGELQDATTTWPAVLDEWAAVLERLGGEFRAGHADVDPKDGLDTCRRTYCELAGLCRINERLVGAGQNDDGDDGEAGGLDD